MSEVRYWHRLGFAVTKNQALELMDRVSDAPSGAVLDGDIEEFETVGAVAAPATLEREINDLFERDFNSEIDGKIDEPINWILVAMEFERNKKQFILDQKEEGKTLEEAKEAYNFAKADIVRKALDLPSIEEVQAMSDDQQRPRDGRGNYLTDEEIEERNASTEVEEPNEEE